MNPKNDYDNQKVKLVATDKSENVKKYADEHMKTANKSSSTILRAFSGKKKK